VRKVPNQSFANQYENLDLEIIVDRERITDIKELSEGDIVQISDSEYVKRNFPGWKKHVVRIESVVESDNKIVVILHGGVQYPIQFHKDIFEAIKCTPENTNPGDVVKEIESGELRTIKRLFKDVSFDCSKGIIMMEFEQPCRYHSASCNSCCHLLKKEKEEALLNASLLDTTDKAEPVVDFIKAEELSINDAVFYAGSIVYVREILRMPYPTPSDEVGEYTIVGLSFIVNGPIKIKTNLNNVKRVPSSYDYLNIHDELDYYVFWNKNNKVYWLTSIICNPPECNIRYKCMNSDGKKVEIPVDECSVPLQKELKVFIGNVLNEARKVQEKFTKYITVRTPDGDMSWDDYKAGKKNKKLLEEKMLSEKLYNQGKTYANNSNLIFLKTLKTVFENGEEHLIIPCVRAMIDHWITVLEKNEN